MWKLETAMQEVYDPIHEFGQQHTFESQIPVTHE